MKKIPTLFERDWAGDKSKVLPGVPKVDLTGAVATRKFDGSAVLVENGKLYRRYDAKHGKAEPPNFRLVERDDETGHVVGWIPVEPTDPSNKWLLSIPMPTEDGTYEFCGPKMQGNPEGLPEHMFIRHGVVTVNAPVTFEGIREYLSASNIEGIVWWKDGVPIAKIKRRDFGLSWPVKKA